MARRLEGNIHGRLLEGKLKSLREIYRGIPRDLFLRPQYTSTFMLVPCHVISHASVSVPHNSQYVVRSIPELVKGIKVVPVLNSVIKHYAMKAYGGVVV
jgi:hypothetical protein